MKKTTIVLARSLASLVLAAGSLGAAAWATQPEPAEPTPPAADAPAEVQPGSRPVNKLCPIMENDVEADGPTRQFKGVTIGFCCPGCDRKWDRKSEEARMALLTKMAPEAVEAIAAAGSPAVKIARDYLDACGKGDAAALNALFLDKGRATVSENAGDEGSWETYRDHHLLPELEETSGFRMTVRKEDVRTFGTASVVRQIGTFASPDPNHPETPRTFDAAVTYVVVDDAGSLKIAHLHWSSRPERKPGTGGVAEAGSGPGDVHGHR